MSKLAATREEEIQRTLLWLRNACRKIADQHDEFGTIYQEALDDLYNAEAAFWKASDTSEPIDGEEATKRAVAEAIDWDRAFGPRESWSNSNQVSYDEDAGVPNPDRDW